MIEGKNWKASMVIGLLVGCFYIFVMNGFSFDSIRFDVNYLGIALSVSMVEELEKMDPAIAKDLDKQAEES
jgi:RsiW-degrading membrane proteinase PrsW (M82 family)